MQNKTVLYVEDNSDNLKVLCLMLSRLIPDHTILTAKSAEEGIHIAMQRPPALILMDICLPGIDGYEALAVLRAVPETQHIPVIAITAYAMADNIRRGREAGFDDYITKPVNIEVLRQSLLRLLPDRDGPAMQRGLAGAGVG